MGIFLDNNSSSKVSQSVIDVMLPYFTDIISPPGSDYGHSFGVEAKQALDNARTVIANKINADADEITFTSGQAEGNNYLIKGIAFSHLKRTNKLLVASSVSHSTVLDTFEYLEKFGFSIELLRVNSEGFIDRDQLKEVLKREPLLISVPHGNVEIGTVEDINEIAEICKGSKETYLHIDATYSFCKVPIDVKKSKIDLLTVSSHLIHGPKGIGAVFTRKNIKLDSLIHGGLQENRHRGGVENLPGIVGFAAAVSEYSDQMNNSAKDLRDYLWKLFEEKIKNFQITGPVDRMHRLQNHFSVVIYFVEGESILLHLDLLGYMIATGSACSSKQLKASHVLTAIGLPTEISHGSVRVGLSHYNTKEEIETFVINIEKVIERLRAMSPMDEEFMKEYAEMKARGEGEDEDHHEIELE